MKYDQPGECKEQLDNLSGNHQNQNGVCSSCEYQHQQSFFNTYTHDYYYSACLNFSDYDDIMIPFEVDLRHANG